MVYRPKESLIGESGVVLNEARNGRNGLFERFMFGERPTPIRLENNDHYTCMYYFTHEVDFMSIFCHGIQIL